MSSLRIATRKSPLAMWQSQHVAQLLQQQDSNLKIKWVTFETEGDRLIDVSLTKIGGKGLFTYELEQALKEDRADFAVHSLKDLPVYFPEGFSLAAVLKRENPFDAFVSEKFSCWQDLPIGAVVGTSSLRRQCLLLHLRPDLKIKLLRGNVGTRLAKLEAGEYDAIVLAAAGLERLGLALRWIRSYFSAEELLPAAGQGVLAIECLTDRLSELSCLHSLHDLKTATCIAAERAVNATLNGGCHVPLAAFAECKTENELHLRAMVGAPSGVPILFAEEIGNISEAENLGRSVSAKLSAEGALDILKNVR